MAEFLFTQKYVVNTDPDFVVFQFLSGCITVSLMHYITDVHVVPADAIPVTVIISLVVVVLPTLHTVHDTASFACVFFFFLCLCNPKLYI